MSHSHIFALFVVVLHHTRVPNKFLVKSILAVRPTFGVRFFLLCTHNMHDFVVISLPNHVNNNLKSFHMVSCILILVLIFSESTACFIHFSPFIRYGCNLIRHDQRIFTIRSAFCSITFQED